MSFINVTKRLGTEIMSSIRISRYVSPAASLLFCGRRVASKKICAEMEEGAICCLLVFEAIRFVRYVISLRIVIRVWRIMFPWPAKRTAYFSLICRMQHVQCPYKLCKSSRIRSYSLRGLFNGSP